MAIRDSFVGDAANPYDRGQLEGQIRSLRDDLTASPAHADARKHLADALLQLGQYRRISGDSDEAIVALLEARGLDPDSEPARIELAGALCDLDYPDEALDFLEPAATTPPASVEYVATRSRALYAVARYQDAVDAVVAVISPPGDGTNPPPPTGPIDQLLGWRGMAQNALDRPEEAAIDLQAAIDTTDHNPRKWQWTRGLGDTLFRLGRVDEAKAVFARVIEDIAKVNPSDLDAEGLATLAWCHHRRSEGNDDFEAVPKIIDSLFLAPKLVHNQFDFAQIMLEKAAQNPDDPDAFDDAEDEYRRGIDLARSKPLVRRTGLLRPARQRLEAWTQSDEAPSEGPVRARIEKLLKLLGDAFPPASVAEGLDRKSSTARLYGWVAVDASCVQAYGFLSKPQSYKQFFQSFLTISEVAPTQEADPPSSTWRASYLGRELRWTTESIERIPYARIQFRQTESLAESPPNGFSFTSTLIPVDSGTLVIFRVSQAAPLAAERLKHDLDGLAQDLNRLKDLIETPARRRGQAVIGAFI